MARNFLESYLHAMPAIEGWFSFDAALMFMAYHQLLTQRGVSGDVLEIGVHHGLSTIALAALRAPDANVYAVDLFQELQGQNISGSGGGNRDVFEGNLRRFFPEMRFLRVLSCASSQLTAERFERPFSFCHIDGGHSVDETCHDLELCHDILAEGGLLALDDYFNPEFPGVCEGAIKFAGRRPGAVRPLAIGFNKVLLQKTSTRVDLNAEFTMRFPAVPRKTVSFWDSPTPLFSTPFRFNFDLQASSPRSLVPIPDGGLEAVLTASPKTCTTKPSETMPVTVTVSNPSKRVLGGGAGVLGVSYHLFGEDGEMLQYDNARVYLTQPLPPGERRVVTLPVQSPQLPGIYLVEIDLVWEGVTWFKEVGNTPPTLRMTVS
jgi:hypothetical protein